MVITPLSLTCRRCNARPGRLCREGEPGWFHDLRWADVPKAKVAQQAAEYERRLLALVA